MMQGGTAAASPHFNDRNKEEIANFWSEDTLCNSLVLLQDHSQPPPGGSALTEVLPSAANLWHACFWRQRAANPC